LRIDASAAAFVPAPFSETSKNIEVATVAPTMTNARHEMARSVRCTVNGSRGCLRVKAPRKADFSFTGSRALGAGDGVYQLLHVCHHVDADGLEFIRLELDRRPLLNVHLHIPWHRLRDLLDQSPIRNAPGVDDHVAACLSDDHVVRHFVSWQFDADVLLERSGNTLHVLKADVLLRDNLVLLVSYFGSAVADIFRAAIPVALSRGNRPQLLREELRINRACKRDTCWMAKSITTRSKFASSWTDSTFRAKVGHDFFEHRLEIPVDRR
jgi:hypothetical protein